MSWNYGDIIDALAAAVPPGNPCLVHGDAVVTWADFTRRTNNLAEAFRARGAVPGDKVAFYMRNRPAYLETLGACFKARLTHVNVNYRYVDEELWYILDNSDAKLVVYDAEFAPLVTRLQARLPNVACWVEVGDGPPTTNFALPFEPLAREGSGRSLSLQRYGDDTLLLYTGGTTGTPKGVIWTHEDHWRALGSGATPATQMLPPADLEAHVTNVRNAAGGRVGLPCCPLMHGTGLFTAIAIIAQGGTVVTLEGTQFDAEELWDTVERRQVNSLAIVGDAFAKPMLRALDENPRRWNLTSLLGIVSSGVMWSPEVKRGLLRHNPSMILSDSFGASEAVGFGRSDTTSNDATEIAKFKIGENCKVFTEDLREVVPGSGEVGFVARSGPIPLGYYKDPEKTARTFPVIDGVRYSMPGDYCRVEADGTLVLLGRGSVCINTAGEKVYPEEVEETLKTHPSVQDALVVGVPDEKWGQAVTAVVELVPNATFDEEALRGHVRERLAGYKTPKRVLAIDDLRRASNGKADYQAITAYAISHLGT